MNQDNSSLYQLAVERGIITDSQKFQLKQLEAETLYSNDTVPSAHTDKAMSPHEPITFLSNYGEMIISAGLLFCGVALAILIPESYYFIPVLLFILLAELLVIRKKMELPAIVLLLMILVLIFDDLFLSIVAPIIAITVSIAYFLRYRTPIAISTACLSGYAVLIHLLDIDIGTLWTTWNLLSFVYGALVIATGVYLDTKDPQRIGIKHKIAFWLHLLGSGMFVSSIGVFVLKEMTPNYQLVSMLLVFVALYLTALYINRRAMLIPMVIHTTIAVTQFFESYRLAGVSDSLVTWIAVMFFGLLLVAVGTWWTEQRHYLFGWLLSRHTTTDTAESQHPT